MSAPPRRDIEDEQTTRGDESVVQVENSQTKGMQTRSRTQIQETLVVPEEAELSQQRLLVEQLQAQVNAINEDVSVLENEIRRFQEHESQPQATHESNSKLL